MLDARTTMNLYEWLLLLFMLIALGICFGFMFRKRLCVLLALLILLPALYISVNTATQLLTADEPQYIYAYTNNDVAPSLLRANGISKNVYQYRTTQLFIGNAMSALRVLRVVPARSQADRVYIVYKCLHYLFSAALLALTGFVLWRGYFPKRYRRRDNKGAASLALVLAFLFAFPVNALMLKVANYDATSTYPVLISMLLAGVYVMRGGNVKRGDTSLEVTEKRMSALFPDKKNVMLVIAATVSATLGAMEKISASPWYCVTIVLLLAGCLRHSVGQSLLRRIAAFLGVAAACAAISIGISAFSMVNILYGVDSELLASLDVRMNCEKVFFPFVYLYQYIATGHIGTDYFVIEQPIKAMLLTYAVIMAAGAGVYGLLHWMLWSSAAPRVQRFIAKLTAVVIIVVVVAGVCGAYFVPQRVVRFLPKDAAYFEQEQTTTYMQYDYGAETKAQHYALMLLNHYGVILAGIPTVCLLLLGLSAALLFGRSRVSQPLLLLFLLGSLLTPIFFAIGGQPAVPRYYATVILLGLLCAITLLAQMAAHKAEARCAADVGNTGKWITPSRCIVSVLFVMFIAEILMFSPNANCFSARWLIQPASLNAWPVQGVWHTGEAMMWGEDYMLACKEIERYYDERGQAGRPYQVYSDYGVRWVGHHTRISALNPDIHMEDTWFSFCRFRVYRKPLPAFLTEVEPALTVTMDGMNAVYIYRGDQLEPYMDEVFEYTGLKLPSGD